MNVKLLIEHYFEFLSLKGGCTGSFESTLVKMPKCSFESTHVKMPKCHVVGNHMSWLNLASAYSTEMLHKESRKICYE